MFSRPDTVGTCLIALEEGQRSIQQPRRTRPYGTTGLRCGIL